MQRAYSHKENSVDEMPTALNHASAALGSVDDLGEELCLAATPGSPAMPQPATAQERATTPISTSNFVRMSGWGNPFLSAC